MSACVAAAAPARSRGTARETRTRTARRATPGRPSGAGPASGCSTRCALGTNFTAGCLRRMTGRARTRGGAGVRPSCARRADNGRRPASSRRCSDAGAALAPRRLRGGTRPSTEVHMICELLSLSPARNKLEVTRREDPEIGALRADVQPGLRALRSHFLGHRPVGSRVVARVRKGQFRARALPPTLLLLPRSDSAAAHGRAQHRAVADRPERERRGRRLGRPRERCPVGREGGPCGYTGTATSR